MSFLTPLDSDDLLPTWVRTYNLGVQRYLTSKKLDENILRGLIQAGLISFDSLYLGIHNEQFINSVRFLFSPDAKTCFITDYTVLAGRGAVTSDIIEMILEICRKKRIRKVVAWVSDTKSDLADNLGEFTFEPGRIRFKMRFPLLGVTETRLIDDVEIQLLKRGDDTFSFLDTPREHCLSIPEIIEISDRQWQPNFIAFDNKMSAPIAVAFISKTRDVLGHIRLLEHDYIEEEVITSAVTQLSNTMYSQGVRDLSTEIDGDVSIKMPFKKSGFLIQSTLFELFLNLLYY